ncbi:MAG: hypothetical protein K2P98_06445 [Neisseriaceae bacterium]|nr:hypothetical protein [Neisseriaceae bacterium]
MKTMFAKYNRERLPKYQTVTKILEDKNSYRYALKEALTPEANAHLENMLWVYEQHKANSSYKLVSAKKTETGIAFEMAKGESLESILLKCLQQNDRLKFQTYIDRFIDLMESFVVEKSVVFEPCEKFLSMFGPWHSTAPCDVIAPANVDLIFSNIFFDETDAITLIDYEWVFNIKVPKDYLIWRSLYVFAVLHGVNRSYFSTVDLNQTNFIQMQDNFNAYVLGKIPQQIIARKPVYLIGDAHGAHDSNIQLFIDNGQGYTEEASIKMAVDTTEELQSFTFDLSAYTDIRQLRLDPLNQACVIDIEKLVLVLNTGEEVDLLPYLAANLFYQDQQRYFFTSIDPNLYFDSLDLSSLSLISLRADIRYQHKSSEAVAATLQASLENKAHVLQQITNDLTLAEQDKQGLSLTLQKIQATRWYRFLQKLNRIGL